MKTKPESLRCVYISKDVPKQFPSNKIITSKYTILTFLPKNLFEQFRRTINLFFLALIIIQFTTDVPVSAEPYAAAFAFVFGVTAIKQGYEDWVRHKADRSVNDRQVSVYHPGKGFQKVKAEKLKVSQIVKLHENEPVPCDLLLLASISKNGKISNQCQITTANLDGEVNLKLRFCAPSIPSLMNGEETFFASIFDDGIQLQYDEPSSDLYKFSGTLLSSKIEKPVNLSADNILLRGATVRNCEFVYGCAIYTGKETRLSLNSKTSGGAKFSTVDRAMNKIVLGMFITLLVLSAIATGLYFLMREKTAIVKAWYLPPEDDSNATVGVLMFFSWLVLLNYAIPISMSVSVELQKFASSKFFGWDRDMTCPNTGTKPLCNTSELNEELGQIEYLFTDKTGTLTENVLTLRHCSINGRQYEFKSGKLTLTGEECDNNDNDKPGNLMGFLRALALCHTVQVLNNEESEQVEDANGTKLTTDVNVEYHASSLDEKVLVEAASDLRFQFLGDNEGELTLKTDNGVMKLKRHATLEFDADRKCMSVIVEDENGDIWVLLKGAESSVLPMCTDTTDKGLMNVTLDHVNSFAASGLRTLLVAQRKLSKEELKDFLEKFDTVRRDSVALSELFREMERNMELLGATGVEDQLQDGVPETLMALKEAGIRIWMLTGDKLETAVNIAESCGLCSSTSKHVNNGFITLVDMTDPVVLQERLEEFHHKDTKKDEELTELTLVMDGITFATAFQHCSKTLCSVALQANQVVFCRMAPLQKAQVVKLVRSSKQNYLTCAVGDGGNDVAMIQEAHIGIGIMGKEGRQAARSADFAVSRFRFLQRAILVHGYWYYYRLATMIAYFFYRGFTFVVQQLLYGIHSAFTAQSIFHSTFIMMYTIAFSSTPPVIFGVFDQNKSEKELLKNPGIYKTISRNNIMAPKQVAWWIFLSIYHFTICFYFPYFMWIKFNALNDWGTFSLFISAVIHGITVVKVLIDTRYFTWFTVIGQAISYLSTILFFSLICEIPSGNGKLFEFAYYQLLRQPEVYLMWILVVVLSTLPDIVVSVINHHKSFSQEIRKYVPAALA